MNCKWWNHGEVAQLAAAAGMHITNLSDVINRKRGVGKDRARTLEDLTRELFGEDRTVPWDEWLFNKESDHPAFSDE